MPGNTTRLAAGCVDLVISDLPYGTTINPWDTVIDFERFWNEYRRIIKPNGVVALTAAGRFTGTVIYSNPQWFRYKIVWIKSRSTNFMNAKKQPLRRHEDICIFYASQPVYHPQMIPGEPYDRGWRKKKVTGCYGEFQPSKIVNTEGPRYPYDVLLMDEEDHDDWFYCKTCKHEKDRPVHRFKNRLNWAPTSSGPILIQVLSSWIMPAAAVPF